MILMEIPKCLYLKSNSLILKNFDELARAGSNMIVRLPLVPGYNDSPRDLEQLASFLKEYRGRIRHAEIMPYHRIGLGKFAAAGYDTKDMINAPDGKSFASAWRDALSVSGVTVKVN